MLNQERLTLIIAFTLFTALVQFACAGEVEMSGKRKESGKVNSGNGGNVPGSDAGKLSIYTRPSGLSKVKNLFAHDGKRYRVEVNGRPVPVYASNGNHPSKIKTAHVALFSFRNMTANVKVHCGFKVKKAAVRPYSRGIRPTVTNNTISFSMKTPKKIWLQANGDRAYPLFIFADEPVEDPGKGKVEHYFGPGVHHIGLKYGVKDNERVYIAGGAVVEGSFDVEKTKNITISGRGIIAGGKWSKLKGPERNRVFESKKAVNLHVEGVTCIGHDSHTFNWDNSGRRVKNVKVIAYNWTTDGPGSIRGPAKVTDCFCVVSDDVLRVEQNARNVLFEDVAIWVYNNNAMIFGQYCSTGNETRNITFRNIDVMVSDVPPGSAVIECDLQNAGAVHDIVFENIRVEEQLNGELINLTIDQDLRPFHNEWDREGQGRLYNITIRNLSAPRCNGRIMGYDANHRVENIVFENLRIKGKKITNLKQTGLKTNAHIRNITFK